MDKTQLLTQIGALTLDIQNFKKQRKALINLFNTLNSVTPAQNTDAGVPTDNAPAPAADSATPTAPTTDATISTETPAVSA